MSAFNRKGTTKINYEVHTYVCLTRDGGYRSVLLNQQRRRADKLDFCFCSGGKSMPCHDVMPASTLAGGVHLYWNEHKTYDKSMINLRYEVSASPAGFGAWRCTAPGRGPPSWTAPDTTNQPEGVRESGKAGVMKITAQDTHYLRKTDFRHLENKAGITDVVLSSPIERDSRWAW